MDKLTKQSLAEFREIYEEREKEECAEYGRPYYPVEDEFLLRLALYYVRDIYTGKLRVEYNQ